MPKFEFQMCVTKEFTEYYTVEAATLAEATELAESGDTVAEEEGDLIGVVSREVSHLLPHQGTLTAKEDII